MPDNPNSTPGAASSGEKRPALGADLIIPVLAFAFAIYFLTTTHHLVWEAKANGVVIGVILLTLLAIQFIRIGRRVATGRATLRLGPIARFDAAQAQRLALILVVALFVATVEWLGISLGLFLLLIASMLVLGVRELRVLLGVALGITVAVYLLFVAFLQTRLPEGPVEWLIAYLLGGGG